MDLYSSQTGSCVQSHDQLVREVVTVITALLGACRKESRTVNHDGGLVKTKKNKWQMHMIGISRTLEHLG